MEKEHNLDENSISNEIDTGSSVENGKKDFSICFGAWDDSRSAEEIINELKADRVNQKEIEDWIDQ